LNKYLLWIAVGSAAIVGWTWLRSSSAEGVQAHQLGNIATITLSAAFIPDDEFTSTYWLPDRIGNAELHRLRENPSECHFNFKSDPHSTLGGVDYRLWLEVVFFANKNAFDADLARRVGMAPTPAEGIDGVPALMRFYEPAQRGERDYASLIWADESRLMLLHFRWRTDRYTPDKARVLLRNAAAGIVIDQSNRAAYFGTVRPTAVAAASSLARVTPNPCWRNAITARRVVIA
jgi:hypothetical protein